MASFDDLTTAQLKQALQFREQIESLQAKLDALLNGGGTSRSAVTPSSPARKTKGKRTVSPEARARMAAAQKARWSQAKAKATPTKAPVKMLAKKKSKMTPEAKAKIAAAMKARWAAKKGASASS